MAQTLPVAATSGDDFADMRSLLLGLQAAIDSLPRRIAQAASDAMRQQHSANSQELTNLWRAMSAEADQKGIAREESLLPGLQAAIDSLPRRIAQAASDAMRQQHSANKQELTNLWRAMSAKADKKRRAQEADEAALSAAREATATTDAQVIFEEFDSRFQWLVGELSARFMVFGNELVRIEKRIADTDDASATNGHSGSNTA